MNRQQWRAAAARNRKNREHADGIRTAMHYLARHAEPSATGATVILPDGSRTYVSAGDARAFYDRGKRPGGRE
jgi:hypothetical protein